MEYTLHDTTAGGIYNGISEFDIGDMIHAEARALGLDILDYSTENVTRILNRDSELKEAAQSTYVPYPVHDDWGEEYKKMWLEMAEARNAPGHGEVPDGLVAQKLRTVLAGIYRTVTLPRKQKEAAEQARRREILSHVESVTTEERKIQDEGGATKQYTHRVLMPSGKTYVFTDRNLFDFGRVLNYDGMMLSKVDGKLGWLRWVDGAGWELEPVEDTDEAVLAYYAAELYGFANSPIRM